MYPYPMPLSRPIADATREPSERGGGVQAVALSMFCIYIDTRDETCGQDLLNVWIINQVEHNMIVDECQ